LAKDGAPRDEVRAEAAPASDTAASTDGFPRPIEPRAFPSQPPLGLARLPVVERELYEIGAEIASGGVGRIRRGRDTRLGRPVAIKELRFDPLGPNAERFVREVMITARLQHPSIVTIYEAGRWPSGEPFYAMQLVNGQSLGAALAGRRTLDERLAVLPHVIAAAEAISYAHSRRVVHRDLKPSNVLVGSFGETVVIDWGLAKDLGEAGAVPEPRPPEIHGTEEGLTAAGAVVGTPAYMPREQAAGLPVDERADVYALGAILYHLVAGTPPYGSRTAAGAIRRVLEAPPRPLGERVPDAPADLIDIIEKAMARDPAARYPSARELTEDLRRFANGQIVSAHVYSRAERVRRFLVANRAAIAVAVLMLAVSTLVVTVAVARVVDARDRAAREREEALRRADDLTLVQARASAEHDPTRAIAWLRTLSPGFDRWSAARVIAAGARAHGIASVLAGHTGAVNDIAFSPDGRLAATSSDDRTLRVWDLPARRSRVLAGHTDETWMLLFLPGGRALASASKDHSIRLTDLTTWQSRALTGHEAAVTGLAVTPDGRLLASSSFDRTIRLWDTGAGASWALRGDGAEVRAVALAPSGRWLASGRLDGTLEVWDLVRGGSKVLGRLDAGVLQIVFAPQEDALFAALWDGSTHACSIDGAACWRMGAPVAGYDPTSYHALALSADGRTLAFARAGGVAVVDLVTRASRELPSRDRLTSVALAGGRVAAGTASRRAALWDLSGGEPRTLHGFEGAGVLVAFSPDGSLLAAAGSSDAAVRLYPTGGASPVRLAHEGGALTVRLVLGDRLLATAGRDGAARIWDLPAPGALPDGAPVVLGGHQGSVALAVAADGLTFATAGEEGSVRVWDRGGHVLHVLAARQGKEPLVQLSPDGAWVAFAGPSGAVQIADTDTGAVRTLAGHAGRVAALAFSPAGDVLASAGQDATVRVWDVRTGAAKVLSHHKGRVTALAFSPDGATLASGGADHTLCLWRAATGEVVRVPVGGGGVQRIAFAPSGDAVLFTSSLESAVHQIEAATGRELGVLLGHEGDVQAFAVSPDEGRVAAAMTEGVVRLWDRRTGESRVVSGHVGAVRDVVWSGDGARVISVGEDGTVRGWEDDLPEEPAALRAWLAQAGGEGVEALIARERR
jgi:WD40 repeat protein